MAIRSAYSLSSKVPTSKPIEQVLTGTRDASAIERNHAAAIHAARQECAQWHVCDHAAEYRLPHQPQQFLLQLSFAALNTVRIIDIPILHRCRRWLALL